tara:strand:- start:551 stop:748 length:198 start_codon:yes stop_codon:yes gene_type:complete
VIALSPDQIATAFLSLNQDDKATTMQLIHCNQVAQAKEMSLMEMALPGNEEYLISWMKKQEQKSP